MSNQPHKLNPFPGLRAFNQDEDYLFFGREEQTIELLQRLGGNRFVAVVGTSGSGKSSLVRCGLLSELLGGKMLQAGAAWEIAVTHPGGNPLALLTEALLEADLYDAEEEHVRENLLATLSRSHFGLVEAVKQSGLGEDTNFLLVVDQFEEIFRFHEAGQMQREAANEFVSILLEAATQKEVPIYVVLTMRSDFIGECGQFEGLAEMVNRGEFLIPRLSREQYKRVIEGPIKVAGGQIAPRLLQRLLNDLGQQADQLPCLQHALMRTWNVWSEKGDTDALDLDDYQTVGKMTQALSLHADEIYDSLDTDRQRQLCKGIFQALTVQESENRGIRRPQRLGSLCQILDVAVDELLPIIDAYRQSGVTFLMPPSEVELTEQTIIDISHESLMRVWTRLRQWVEEETQAVGIYRRLSESAALHEQGKAGLYRDPELGIAVAWQSDKRPNEAWAARYHPGFASAISFLKESQQAQLADERAREEARQRELEQAHKLAEVERQRAESEQQAARRLRRLAVASALVAVFAVGASIVAGNFWWVADGARQAAQMSEQSARDSAVRAQHEAERATAQEEVAKAARDDAQREAARATEQETLATQARDEAEVRAYTASLAAAVADLDRNDSRTLRRRLEEAPERLRGWEWTYLWNEADRSLETTLELPPANEGYEMALSRDGQLVAVRPYGGNSEPVTVYDTRTGSETAVLKTYSSSFPLMTFSADHKLLAYHHHGTPGVQIFEISTGRALVPKPHEFWAFLGFDPPGERAVMLDEKGKLRVFKTADWSVEAELPATGTAIPNDFRRRGAISPDGKLLAVSAFSTDPMRIYDLSTNTLLKEIPDTEPQVSLQFSDKSDSVTTVSPTGLLIQYAAPDWNKIAYTVEGRQDRSALTVYRLDDQLLRLTFDTNGAVVLYDSELERTATLRGHGAPGMSIAVDSEREQIVTTHRNGEVRRWDLRHPQDLRLGTGTVAFTPDDAAAYAGVSSSTSRPNQLCAVDASASQVLGFLRSYPPTIAHGSSASQMAYSPDGRRVAVATTSGWGWGRWRVYDSWTGLAEHEGTSPDLDSIDWSADGRWIALGGKQYGQSRGYVGLFDSSTYQSVADLTGDAGGIHSVAFSHDSQQLVTASEDGMLRIWEISTGKLLNTLGKSGDSAINCVAYSPNGSHLLAGSADGTVTAWHPLNGEPVFQSKVHGAGVKCLAFTPDGTRLMTAAADRSLKVIDPSAWRELLTMHLESPANGMSFSPDGKRLALATGSLIWLETEPEADRSSHRQLARKDNERATVLVQEVLDKTKDPLQAREQIVAQSAADEGLQRASLQRLRIALDSQWQAEYDVQKLSDALLMQMLRQQIVLGKDQRATGAQRTELIAAINATNVNAIQRQALAEFASAVMNWSFYADTENVAWQLVLDSGESPDRQFVAYFGIEPTIRQKASNVEFLKTMAMAEYRVGLYADSLATAEQGAALSGDAAGPKAQLLAIIAMSQHRTGNSEAAAETLTRLDEMLKTPSASADQQIVALSREARTVLATPIDGPWNAEAAWTSCKARLEQLDLDQPKIISWQARSLERMARSYSARGEHEQAKVVRSRVRTLYETQLATSPDDAFSAQSLADHLLQLPTDAKTILPTSESEGVEWLSTTTQPPDNWANEDFDDSTWKKDLSGFGAAGSPAVTVRTDWNTNDIWLRRTFEWQPSPTEQSIVLRLVYDDDVEIYFNGQQAASLPGWTPQYITHLLDASAVGVLHAGTNTIAVHCHQNAGGQHIDVGVDAMPHEQLRLQRHFAAMKITDPWVKLAAAYYVIGDDTALERLLESHPNASAAIGDMYAAEQSWDRAIAEYSKLITDETTDAALLSKRGEAYFATGQRDLARADWQRALQQEPDLAQKEFDRFKLAQRWGEAAEFGLFLIEQKPEDTMLWVQVPPIAVLSEDEATYGTLCRKILELFQKSPTFSNADRAIKGCLLKPGAIDIADLPLDKLPMSLDATTAPAYLPPWFWATRALLAYRSGDAESAVAHVTLSEQYKPNEPAHALNLSVLAMAQSELKHADEARIALDEAAQLITRLQAGDRNHHDVLIAEILFREAESLLADDATPSPENGTSEKPPAASSLPTGSKNELSSSDKPTGDPSNSTPKEDED